MTIADHGCIAGTPPELFELVQGDLDGSDADDLAVRHDPLCIKVAGFFAGGAQAVERTTAACERFLKIRPVTEVQIDEAIRLVPIARCERAALHAHDVERIGMCAPVDRCQIAVNPLRDGRVARLLQQLDNIRVQIQQGRQVSVACQFAFQGCVIDIGAMDRRTTNGFYAQLLGTTIRLADADRDEQEHPGVSEAPLKRPQVTARPSQNGAITSVRCRMEATE